MRSLSFSIIVFALAIAACSSSPANVAGDYTIAVTIHDNGCKLANWTVGDSASNIAVTIAQNGTEATATVGGATGPFLDLVLGDHVFKGTVDGDFLHLTLIGVRAQTSGNCAYTYNAVLDATLVGNALMGTLDYKAQTNGNPDCASMSITGCTSEQALSGSRPPA